MSPKNIPSNWIPRKEAIKQVINRFPELKLDEKTVKNWVESGRECEQIKHTNGRYYFESEKVKAWYPRIEKSYVILDKEDYLKCVSFAIEAYYTMTASHFDRSTQRDAGEFLTNQVEGKLGELALAKLLEKHGLKVKLDFEFGAGIPSQDISQISIRRGVWNNPAVKVSIKTTKLKNVLLAVTENEAKLPDRKSDVYVLSQVGLFSNHVFRFIKDLDPNAAEKIADLVPAFERIPARIAGWVSRQDLTSTPLRFGEQAREKFGFRPAKPNYILRSAELSTDWEILKRTIIGN